VGAASKRCWREKDGRLKVDQSGGWAIANSFKAVTTMRNGTCSFVPESADKSARHSLTGRPRVRQRNKMVVMGGGSRWNVTGK
jgi:hypothetical protein